MTAHNKKHDIASTDNHDSLAAPNNLLQADANGNPVDATNTNAQVSAAITASHARAHAMNSASDHSAATQGNVPYAGAAGAWAVLAPGTSGYFLKTQGAGANPIWAVVAGGTGSTAEVFLSGCEYNANNGSYRARTLASTTGVRFTFRFPIDFGAITKLVLIVIPGSSVVNKQYALASEYGAVGEASNINNQSATVTVASFTSSQIAEINLATVFTSAAANDYAGVLVTGQSGVAVSCDVLGVLLRYTRV
jgi:roadblock/LC7 domain-containing protein